MISIKLTLVWLINWIWTCINNFWQWKRIIMNSFLCRRNLIFWLILKIDWICSWMIFRNNILMNWMITLLIYWLKSKKSLRFGRKKFLKRMDIQFRFQNYHWQLWIYIHKSSILLWDNQMKFHKYSKIIKDFYHHPQN